MPDSTGAPPTTATTMQIIHYKRLTCTCVLQPRPYDTEIVRVSLVIGALFKT